MIRRMFRMHGFTNLAIVSISLVVVSCDDPVCPEGTTRVSERCIVATDMGVGVAGGANENAGAGVASSAPNPSTIVGSAGVPAPLAGAGNGAAGPFAGSGQQTGNAGAAASFAASSGAGAPSRAAETCSTEGMIRCGVADPSLREKCSNGAWVPVSGCASGETCASDGSCRPVVDLCRSNAGEAVCDSQGAMLLCNEDASATPLERCMSSALCRAGLPGRACATCIPNEHRCTGVRLDVCSSDGMNFAPVQDCETAGLCNAMLGRCTSAVCDPNKRSCMGNTLVTCNADGTDFTNQTVQCGSGMCDSTGGDCNICQPGEKRCDGPSAQTCDATGQGYTASPCSTGHCTGAGSCVACTEDSHCPSNDPCKTASCTSDNRCSARNAVDGTSCVDLLSLGNVCIGGICVECADNGDCGTLAPVCDTSRNRCVQCLTEADCPSSATCSFNSCVTQPFLKAGSNCSGDYVSGGTVAGVTWCALRCTTKEDCQSNPPTAQEVGAMCSSGHCGYLCNQPIGSTLQCPSDSTCYNAVCGVGVPTQ